MEYDYDKALKLGLYGILLSFMTIILVTTLISAEAQCVQTISDSGILCGENNTDCEFAVGQSINDITIFFTSEVSEEELSIRAFLYENADCSGKKISEIPPVTSSNGEIRINCDDNINCLKTDEIKKSGDYCIKAIIDSEGINQELKKSIYFKKSLVILLNCPTEGVIDRDIKCTFKFRDSDNPDTLLNPTPIITVTQGGEIISHTPTSDSIIFSTSITGSVSVKMRAVLSGYLDGKDEALIKIDDPVNNKNFLIDDKSFFELTENIASGNHKIVIKTDKSGVPLDISNIEAIIVTPSKQEVPLNFVRISSSEMKTTYNFLQDGTTYVLKGTIFFEDESELPSTFEYEIPVGGSITKAYEGSLSLIIWSIIGGVIAIIIIFVIIGLVFRRK